MKNIFKFFIFFVATASIVSCEEYLDVKPVGKVIPETLADFRAVLTKGYDVYPDHKSLATLRSDELLLNEFSDDLIYYKDIYLWNDANPDRITTSFQYADLYNSIFYTNVIINEASKKLPISAERDQLIGEAYALRALAYFDLVNLFSKPYNAATAASDRGVPLALEIDLEQVFSPESVAAVYSQIIFDKDQAKSLLNLDTQATGINYRFSKVAVYALESRIYLYQNDWNNALASAELALSYKNTLVNFNNTPILPNNYDSVESILALEDVFVNRLKSASYVSNELLSAFDQSSDLRFSVFFQLDGTKYKFKKGGELGQKCSFRTSELYLTKAETAAQLDNLALAKDAINIFVATRYSAESFEVLTASINSMQKTELLHFIAQERFREFAAEGHRWFDLRRNNQKEIQHTLDGNTSTLIANDPRYTLPFPADARLNNPEL